MTDIVKILRSPPFGTETSERRIMLMAADEIEILRHVLDAVSSKVGRWEVVGFDETGTAIKKRWPITNILAQTIEQFADLGLRTEVRQYLDEHDNRHSDGNQEGIGK